MTGASGVVAVTGHRQLDAEERARVARAGREVLARFQGAGEVGVVLDALAEGSDQVLAQAALDLGLPLHAQLPQDRAATRAALEDEASRATFDALLASCAAVHEGPRSAGPPDGPMYGALGEALVARASTLVAVWDPRRKGGEGGTEDVIARALEAGRRVIWIDPSTGRVDETLSADMRCLADELGALSGEADIAAGTERHRLHATGVRLATLATGAVTVAALGLALMVEDAAPLALLVLGVSELLMLIAALVVVDRHRTRRTRDTWLARRTQAELLRRERALFLGRLGPYAIPGERGESLPARRDRLRARRELLRTLGAHDGGSTFLPRLATLVGWDHAAGPPRGADREPEVERLYTRWRLRDQASWFQRTAHTRRHEAHARHTWAERIFWLALLATAGHVAILVVEMLAHVHLSIVGLPLMVAAVILPALVASIEMVHQLRQDQADSHRFEAMAAALEALERDRLPEGLSTAAWLDRVETLLLAEHLAWRAQVLAQDLKAG